MCLTLANAAEVLDHRTAPTLAGGFTCTSHHAGHLAPGDMWRPEPTERPRTVTELRRHADLVTLVDQVGDTYSYPVNAILPTAVPDPLVVTPRILFRQ